MQYLQSAEMKKLDEIVYGDQYTGDSWQEYAWRWALCHLLANNPNYADRFRPLGLGLLNGRDVDFRQVYGAMYREILFEYEFFINHLDQGLRADLISFDWNRKFRKSLSNSPAKAKITANRGWQPSGLMVDSQTKYQFSAEGQWTLAKDGPTLDSNGNTVVAPPEPDSATDDTGVVSTAKASPDASAELESDDGQQPRAGQLVGIVLTFDEKTGYHLSKPFSLGRFGTFTAPATGNLYLRCNDRWNEIADNLGEVSALIKEDGPGSPLREPRPEVLRPQRRTRSGR